MALSIAWVFIMVIAGHFYFSKAGFSFALCGVVITGLLLSMALHVYRINDSNYEVMASRIYENWEKLVDYESVYNDCLIQLEIDRLVGHLWRTRHLLTIITQTHLDDGRCQLHYTPIITLYE